MGEREKAMYRTLECLESPAPSWEFAGGGKLSETSVVWIELEESGGGRASDA